MKVISKPHGCGRFAHSLSSKILGKVTHVTVEQTKTDISRVALHHLDYKLGAAQKREK